MVYRQVKIVVDFYSINIKIVCKTLIKINNFQEFSDFLTTILVVEIKIFDLTRMLEKQSWLKYFFEMDLNP